MNKGMIHIYTGNGKGKTSAALGIAVRAAGAGLKTLIIQFMKEYPYSEKESLKVLSEYITFEQYGGDKFVYEKRLPNEEEKSKIYDGITSAKEAINDKNFDIIILDEIFIGVYFKVFGNQDIISILEKRNTDKELILTGRYADKSIIEMADLVTEMKEVKHYYQQGVLSRKGIDS